jgi:hypothetical protein
MAEDSVNADRQEAADFILVSHAQGGLAADGRHLLVEATTVGRGCVRPALRLADMQHFVTLLLQVLSQAAQPSQPDGPGGGRAASRQPVRLSAIEIGQFDDGAGFLTVTVGPTSLTFEIPSVSIERLGSVLLAARAETDRRR